MREIRNDKALREICNLDVVPSDSAIGYWLRRLGKKKGVRAFEKVNDEFMKSIIRLSQVKNGTLVIDPTIVKLCRLKSRSFTASNITIAV